MFRFGDSDAVRRIHAASDGGGVDIEVLAVNIDLMLRDHFVNRILDPFERFGIPVVNTLPVPVFRMCLQDWRGIGHAFELRW